MTTQSKYIPDRGDIAWMILDPRVGHEQSGRRPVIVLSYKEMAEHTRLAVIMPITSKAIGLPFEIVLTGTKTTGAILPFQVRSVDYITRNAVFIEKAPPRILAKSVKAVQNMVE
ncbi:type II toxin-antitoxin system PemK/MazF family toxin [Candidatus Saccharibacteria bacterium]|nr:type II toxin-antitoxin system PemK/MazF family toxin [Candidatus Saccharibacteria bacterium]